MVVCIWVQQRELLVIANFKEAEGSPANWGATEQSQEGQEAFVRQAPRPEFRMRTNVI